MIFLIFFFVNQRLTRIDIAGMILTLFGKTIKIMKKIIASFVFLFSVAVFSASAQETKTKPVTTPTDKVHNVIHPHHKIAHGTKHKHESVTGKKTVTEVKTTKAEAADPKKKKKKD